MDGILYLDSFIEFDAFFGLVSCTCDGNFGGPVGRAFQHGRFCLFYGVYVSVRIHIKYDAVDIMAFGMKRQLHERWRTAGRCDEEWTKDWEK